MKTAVELLPRNLVGLRVSVGEDGVWLHFATENPKLYASFNVGHLADRLKQHGGDIFSSTLNQWHNERVEQAKQMEALKL